MNTHHCLTDPGADFPCGLPDVAGDGKTGDGRGPFDHVCHCGKRWVWRESAGFVSWTCVEKVETHEVLRSHMNP